MLDSIKRTFLPSFNMFIRKLAARTHKAEMMLEWSGKKPAPAYFNHHYDLYFQWPSSLEFHWLERGIFNSFFIRQNANLLELCCGDGFNTKHFYSKRAAKVTAIDIEPTAIDHAKKFNQKDNITYLVGDITQPLPAAAYDNVIIDAAIEQLSSAQQETLLQNIKQVLKKEGSFSGLSIQKKQDTSYLHHNQNEFASMDELRAFLLRSFAFVQVLTNNHNGKTHLYFIASESPIKFSGS